LDEDVHPIKNQYKLCVSTASKVLTQWLTWCGRTLTFLGMIIIHNSICIVISMYLSAS